MPAQKPLLGLSLGEYNLCLSRGFVCQKGLIVKDIFVVQRMGGR